MKRLFIVLIAGILLLAAPILAGGRAAAQSTEPTKTPNAAWENIKEGASQFAEGVVEGALNIAEDVKDAWQNAEDYFSGVGTAARLKDAREGIPEGIEISATVLERAAILPGSVFRVRVTVSNTGESNLYYRMGSSSFTVPEAVFASVKKLQAIPSEDRLRAATTDMQIRVLRPGESMGFDFPVLAAEPSRAFESDVLKQYAAGSYAGDMDIETVREKFPEMKTAAPGSYTGEAYFLYYLGGAESADDHVVMVLGDTNEYYVKVGFTVQLQGE